MTKFQLHSLKRSRKYKYNNIMNLKEKIKKIFGPKLKLLPGTRLTSFFFIGVSVLIAGAILFAANIYYNLDTGEIVMEEVQRAARLIKATAGLIVGGENLTGGYVFEVVGSSKLATTTIATGPLTLSAAGQELRFTGGTNYYVGFKVPTNLSTTSVYIWPGSYPQGSGYVLTSDASGNMTWIAPGTAGLGDISAVGNVESGEAFTYNYPGTTLWFGNTTHRGALTVASLTNNATYTLPDIAGTNYLTLSSGPLGTGSVLFSSNDLIATSSNFVWDNNNRILTLGSAGQGGQLRIYSDASGGYFIGFKASSTLATSTTYSWPAPPPSTRVLVSDPSGNLSWQTVSGVGALSKTGTISPGYVAFFVDEYTLTGTSNFIWSTTTNTLTIGGTIVANTFTGPSGATTTLSSASGQNILIDPATGKVILGTGDWIETSGGYQIGKTGTQVLREMVPIFGFDLPVKTATTTYVKISRDIVNYPLNPCATGTTRVHKLVIRYGATATSTWQVATSSGGYAEITVPPTGATSTGSVYTIQTDIPTPSGICTGWTQGTETDDWWVRMKLNATGEIMIYQIFLAGYDQIQ